MANRNIILSLIFFLVILAISTFSYSQANTFTTRRLIVFYSPACHKCIQTKMELMPEIEKEFKGKILIEYYDITDIDNYKLMLGLQEKYSVKINNILPVFYFEGKFLNGEGKIRNNLKQLIASSLNKPVKKEVLASIDLISRFKNFQPLAIINAGLIDGINPCAFTVIVFFISFLALQGYKKIELIIIGLSFIFTVFLTYLLLGLGLFNFLYSLRGFWLVVKIFNFSVAILSIILGILCLYDFFKFKKTRQTEGLILQLPKTIKNQIYKIIGLHYRVTGSGQSKSTALRKHIFNLILSAIITGFLVSILEAICTGQMYLPTIAFVLKTTHLKLEALGYLLLYNFMFIIPLLAIFLFALLGVTSEEFSRFLKKHFLTLKILMGILFFSLGIFLLWRL